MNRIITSTLFLIVILLSGTEVVLASTHSDLLTPEENFYLDSRNRTIVVFLEKNNPPFSYSSPGGNIQGLSVDYLELIADKINVKLEFLLPQSRVQVVNEFLKGKGDVTDLMENTERQSQFIFTESFLTVPAAIVARKDFNVRESLNLNDFNGKKVAVKSGSALETYIRKNYPRVVLEDMTDNEIILQQVVLGEVEAGVLDVASLFFYLSKQVLSSVKIIGNVGFDYKPAFALRPDSTILQDILEKGMTQISIADRELLNEKWIVIPGLENQDSLLSSLVEDNARFKIVIPVLGVLLVAFMFLFFKRKEHIMLNELQHARGSDSITSLKQEVLELERMNDTLSKDLRLIKEEEDKLQAKIESLNKTQ